MDLTFSQLLKILRPHLGKGRSVIDFTYHIIQSTVSIPEGEDESALDISDPSLRAYYYGNNNIDKLAEKLSGRIDASKLYEEIGKLNETARQLIADSLQPYYPGAGLDDVADICSAAMEKIFSEAAARSSKSSDNTRAANTSQPSAITDDELTLVLETKGICRFDDCGNPLSVTVNGKKQYLFSITKIDPALDDSLDNMIALCPDCSAKYKLLGQPSDVERLKHIKKQLKMRGELDDVAAMTKREEGIRLVIERIANMRSEDLIPLNYKPVAVEKKVSSSNLILRQKILSYVNGYYPVVKKIFQIMNEAQKIYYEGFAMSVRMTYMKENQKGAPQSMIFNALVDWLMNGTNTDRESCEVVIAYFVQNCEVFDEISE